MREQQPHGRRAEVPLRSGEALLGTLGDGAGEDSRHEQQPDEYDRVCPERKLQVLAAIVIAEGDGHGASEVTDREQARRGKGRALMAERFPGNSRQNEISRTDEPDRQPAIEKESERDRQEAPVGKNRDIGQRVG